MTYIPHAKLIEDIPQLTANDWRESQNLGFEFLSGLDCYGAEKALDRLSIATDCGASVNAGVELKKLMGLEQMRMSHVTSGSQWRFECCKN